MTVSTEPLKCRLRMLCRLKWTLSSLRTEALLLLGTWYVGNLGVRLWGLHCFWLCHRLRSPAVFIEPFPWLRGPPCDSVNPGMFAEHMRWFQIILGFQGCLSPKEERHMHVKGSTVEAWGWSEWSGNDASETVMLLCVLRRFKDLLSRTIPAVFFPQP